MKSHPRLRTFTLVCGCAAAAAIAVPGVSVAEKLAQDVFVRNTPDNPVPTAAQGTTTVAGTVAVSNTPTVQVGNDGAAPVPVRDVAQPTRRPFQREVCVFYTAGLNHGIGRYRVPAGKRVVIEHVAYGAGGAIEPIFVFRTDDPPAVMLSISDSPDPRDRPYRFALDVDRQDYTRDGVPGYVVNQPLLAFAGPEHTIIVDVFSRVGNDTSSNDCGGAFTITGYEEDA